MILAPLYLTYGENDLGTTSKFNVILFQLEAGETHEYWSQIGGI